MARDRFPAGIFLFATAFRMARGPIDISGFITWDKAAGG
jgi:hypothetical protein